MIPEIHSQVKGTFNVIFTTIVGLAPIIFKDTQILWGVILGFILLQILALLLPSIEETYYNKRVKHVMKMDDLDRDQATREKEFKNAEKTRRMTSRLESISNSDRHLGISENRLYKLLKNKKNPKLKWHQ